MSGVLIRVVGAPFLLGSLGLCLYVDWKLRRPAAILVVMAVFSAGAFHELCAMARSKGVRPLEWLGHVLLVLLYVAFGLSAAPPEIPGGIGHMWAVEWPAFAWAAVMPVLVIMCLFAAAMGHRSRTPIDAGFTFLAASYVMLLSWVLCFQGTPREWLGWLLFLIATAKGSDMAAYVVGKLIGRHPMAPELSAHKTWEGAMAGLAAGTGLGVAVLSSFDLGPRAGSSAAGTWMLSAGVTFAAQIGDLVKSAFKRWAGVKDSGRWIPEFGGALDMVDSFLIAAPTAVFLTFLLH